MTRPGRGRKGKEKKRKLPDRETNVAAITPDAQRTGKDGAAQNIFTMLQYVFFKTDPSEPVEISCTRDGRIDFSELASAFVLDPKSIKLNGVLYPKSGLKSEAQWEEIKETFQNLGRPVGTEDAPVMVTGVAPVLAVPERPVAAQQDPFRRLITEASMDPRIPEVSELKHYLLQPPRMAFPVSQRRYLQLMNYLSKADNFICHDPARGVCWNLDDHLGIELRPPPTGSTESSFHSFWDLLVNEPISLFSLETLVFDRDSAKFSSSENKRPDKLGLVSRLALWRGEEKGPDTEGDPKQELAVKLIWTYGDMPYLLCYYAKAAIVTYCALVHDAKRCKTQVVDLITVDLFVPEDRLLALLIGFNISKLLMRLSAAAIALGVESDFYDYHTDGKTVHVGSGVDKIYKDQSTFEKVRQIYESIEGCPNAEQVLKVNIPERRFRMIPRCLVKSLARPEDELLRALINVAEAVVWLHGKNLMHRDISWRNVLKNASGTNWVLIDFDETSSTPCGHAHGLCVEAHAPETGRGRHDSSVDIWGIGHLIRSSGIRDLSADVLDLQRDCLEIDASKRPSAEACLGRLKLLDAARKQGLFGLTADCA